MPEVTFDFLPGQSYQFHVYNTSTDSTITALNGFQIYFTEKASISVIDSQPKVIGCDAEDVYKRQVTGMDGLAAAAAGDGFQHTRFLLKTK